jgi:mycobactin lysine-N-oxygenase
VSSSELPTYFQSFQLKLDSEKIKKSVLAIVGGGVKAMAIAAKCEALKKLGLPTPHLVIFEKDEVGANWSGKSGFTDGKQILGTPPTKDVGYPYASECWGKNNQLVNQVMIEFSYNSYLISQKKYAHWIDCGQPPVSHKDWSNYIKWLATKVEVELKISKVDQVDIIENCWRVGYQTKAGNLNFLKANGIVITGPGKPNLLCETIQPHPRILDGQNFWLQLNKFKGSCPKRICIVGAGEAAGSILSFLSNQGIAIINIVTTSGIIYTRCESPTENTYYSNPLKWKNLTEKHRREFINRTDRGVISSSLMEVIGQSENISFIPGVIDKVEAEEKELHLYITCQNKTIRLSYDYLIQCLGTDRLWFKKLLTDNAEQQLCRVTGGWNTESFENLISEDLSISNFKPSLHLPMLAGVAQGPGFPNLSCLGLLSDCILASYIQPQQLSSQSIKGDKKTDTT